LLALWVSHVFQSGFKGAQNDLLIGMGSAPLEDSQFRTAAFEQLGESRLEGAVAVIVSPTDEIAPAAAIKKYMKEFFDKKKKTSKVGYAGSIFEGKFCDVAATAIIAETPSREESLAKIIGMLKSGPQKLHGVLGSGFSKLFNVLENAEKFAA